MMKALMVAADSVSPELILKNRGMFPALNTMVEQGAVAAYGAYVQKGYEGSYSSEQNWASIYTGLSPKAHRINTGTVKAERRRPEMRDFHDLEPFWKRLNDSGISVGLWAADNCVKPVSINGYVVSSKYEMIQTPVDHRWALREIQLCEKDRHMAKYLEGPPPPRLYPKTLAQQGYTFEQLKQNPEMAEEAIRKYCFEDALENFRAELEYWFGAMARAQREKPVDVLYLYTPTTDLIAHCCMCSDDNPVLLGAYQLLDQYMGDFLREFQPETAIFLSDHGQQNFKELISCSDPAVQREAFAARDQVLWLKNGYIAFEAHNGALLFTAHALKGTFIAAGKGIRHVDAVAEMRTLDIYPTLLELFEVAIPEDRQGYVADIFDRPLINQDRRLQPEAAGHVKIALIQTHAMSVMDIVVNELYLERRFARITVVGEEKYREIFLGNPRVHGFRAIEQFSVRDFDEVYCGFFNEETKKMNHIRIV